MVRPAYSQSEIDSIHDEICSHTIALFRETGIRGLSLRALAARMGWTAAALYRYFANKEELLDAVRAQGFERMADRLRTARKKEADPGRALEHVIRAYLEFAFEEPQLFQLMYQLDQGEAPTGPLVREKRSMAFAEARAAGESAVEAGLVHGDPNVATHVIWAGCHGLASLAIAEQLDLGCSYEDLVGPMIERLTYPLDRR